MSRPLRGEVRESGLDRYYIEGPPADPAEYTEPVIRCIQVEGSRPKMGYVVPEATVAHWPVVSRPIGESA